MHTNTSKAVLSPLADAVSSLIVIVSDAETGGTPIPDLSALASGVEAQILNLVNVGKKIEAQPNADVQLKHDMPLACTDVTKSAQLLVTSTKDLVADPFSAAGRQNLLDAVKGILAGTTQVLNVFDDAEVRKILNACSLLRTHLGSIAQGPASPAETQAYVQTIAQASQTIVVLAQLTNKRVGELLHAVLQTRLKAAISSLTKESPVLIGACKLSLIHPNNENARLVRIETCGRLFDAIKEIEVVVQFTTEDEGLAMEGVSNIGKLRKALVEEHVPRIVRALQSGTPQEVRIAIADYATATRGILDHARERARRMRDPKQKAHLETILEEIEEAQRKVDAAVSKLEEDSSDPAKQAAVRSAIDSLLGRTDALQISLNRSLISDANGVVANLSDHSAKGTLLNRVHETAVKGDSAGLPEAIAVFTSEAQCLQSVISAAIDAVSVTNPQLAQELRIARDRIKGLAGAYEGAAKLLASNPRDPAIQEHYNAVVSAWEEGVQDIQKAVIGQEGVFKAHELISGTRNGFEEHAQALADAAAKGDVKATQQEAALLVSAANQFIAIARKEAENTEDPAYRRELEVKIRDVETVLPTLLSGAQIILNSFTDSSIDAAFELSSVVRDLTSKLSDLGNVIRSYKGGPSDVLTTPAPQPEPMAEQQVEQAPLSPVKPVKDEIAELTEQMQDVVIVEEEKPMLLSEEEAKAEPIKAAGQELKVEASNWTAEQNSIVEAVTVMSQNILDLSTFHGQLRISADPATKKAFISAAQQITAQATGVAKSAHPLVKECTDKRLKAQLLGALDKIQTLGQQLKIVAAVKASAPTDRDQDAQLVACATNLMNAVKGCLRDCESASLRISPSVLERIGVRFRRQIYRAKQFGQ